MILKVSNKITVLFTDGDICQYDAGSNKLRLLRPGESLAVGEKILKVLKRMEEQNNKINEQKAKINASLGKLLK